MEITRLREFLGKQMNTKWKHFHFYAYIHQIVWKKLWKALRVRIETIKIEDRLKQN